MSESVPPRPRKRAAVVSAVLGLVTVGVLGTVAVATGGQEKDDVVQAAVPGCLLPESGDQDLWVDEERWTAVMDRVESALARKFGQVSKTDKQRAPLAKGLIGRVLDYDAEEFVVVADPAKVDLEALQAGLGKITGDVTDVRVQAGCHSSDDLLAAERVLRARTWHPDVDKMEWGSVLDARTSTYRVTMPAGPVADALKSRLGDLVTMQEGTVSFN